VWDVTEELLRQCGRAGNVEEGIRLAAEKGIEFSAEELAPESEGRDLDDAELDAVAGGGFWGDLGDAALCVVTGLYRFY